MDYQENDIAHKIAYGVWIQAIGQFIEAIYVSKLFTVQTQKGKEDLTNEEKILFGVWIQAIGQLQEAVGVTQQLSASSEPEIRRAEELTVTGNWLQGVGSTLEAYGGTKEIIERRLGVSPPDYVIP
ncbi:hypothetical protein ACERII_07705 [Evansella sp. AB-rgal1]|uniref:DUF6944 family repetitive protein n=1 Tax=Evansella sp. AB-rgal1 TaxID=3242696 RepID=UPI00359CED87